jgi:glutamate synthase (NADPH/NADH)
MERLHSFGYTAEGSEMLLGPMALGEEGLGSMGNDAALACLSNLPRYPYDYFHQLFAQVTNPPIDPIREGIVMSLGCFVGPEGNLLEDISHKHLRRLYLENPILDLVTLEELTQQKDGRPSSRLSPHGRKLRTSVVDITYPREEGEAGLKSNLVRICEAAASAIEAGAELIVLSDRKTCKERVQVSGLLATAATHAHLVKTKQRLLCGIILESAEPHEVHHFSVLFGFGCDAVCPYGAYSALWKLRQDAKIPDDLSDDVIVKQYKKSCWQRSSQGDE